MSDARARYCTTWRDQLMAYRKSEVSLVEWMCQVTVCEIIVLDNYYVSSTSLESGMFSVVRSVSLECLF